MSNNDMVFHLYGDVGADLEWFFVGRIFHKKDIYMASNFHGFDCAVASEIVAETFFHNLQLSSYRVLIQCGCNLVEQALISA